MSIQTSIKKIKQSCQLDDTALSTFPVDETVITISVQMLIPSVTILLEEDIWHLSTITCQQIEEEIILLYHFWEKKGLTLRLSLDSQFPKVDSLTALIPGAEFYEREVHEMFGVEFIGLQNTAPLLLPDDWEGGYPLRENAHASVSSNHNKKKKKGESS